MFTILPEHVDKYPINFLDFQLRTKLQNKKSSELPPPEQTLQLIGKSNKTIFAAFWN